MCVLYALLIAEVLRGECKNEKIQLRACGALMCLFGRALRFMKKPRRNVCVFELEIYFYSSETQCAVFIEKKNTITLYISFNKKIRLCIHVSPE